MKNDDNEIIVSDEQTREEDQGVQGSLYPYDPTKADIDIRDDAQSVYQYVRQYTNGKLIIDPDFQRNLVWKPWQKSRFIESIILNFPLPPFYLNQKVDGKYIVIDGLQRTTTLLQFLNDEFELVDLEALPSLMGSKFSRLTDDIQSKIEDKKLVLYVLKPSVPIKIIYDLFNRINTNGTPLNRQEVRNCIYIGKSTKLLKELAGYTDKNGTLVDNYQFKKAIDYGIAETRMKDREAVLRFLAFSIYDYKKDYQGDMSDFVENTMERINLMFDIEIEALKVNFERVMNLTYDFFGDLNFRLPTESSRGRINIAILESVSYFFLIKSDEYLLANKSKIQEQYKYLLQDPIYFESVRFSTGDKNKVINRFEQAISILSDI